MSSSTSAADNENAPPVSKNTAVVGVPISTSPVIGDHHMMSRLSSISAPQTVPPLQWLPSHISRGSAEIAPSGVNVEAIAGTDSRIGTRTPNSCLVAAASHDPLEDSLILSGSEVSSRSASAKITPHRRRNAPEVSDPSATDNTQRYSDQSDTSPWSSTLAALESDPFAMKIREEQQLKRHASGVTAERQTPRWNVMSPKMDNEPTSCHHAEASAEINRVTAMLDLAGGEETGPDVLWSSHVTFRPPSLPEGPLEGTPTKDQPVGHDDITPKQKTSITGLRMPVASLRTQTGDGMQSRESGVSELTPLTSPFFSTPHSFGMSPDYFSSRYGSTRKETVGSEVEGARTMDSLRCSTKIDYNQPTALKPQVEDVSKSQETKEVTDTSESTAQDRSNLHEEGSADDPQFLRKLRSTMLQKQQELEAARKEVALWRRKAMDKEQVEKDHSSFERREAEMRSIIEECQRTAVQHENAIQLFEDQLICKDKQILELLATADEKRKTLKEKETELATLTAENESQTATIRSMCERESEFERKFTTLEQQVRTQVTASQEVENYKNEVTLMKMNEASLHCDLRRMRRELDHLHDQIRKKDWALEAMKAENEKQDQNITTTKDPSDGTHQQQPKSDNGDLAGLQLLKERLETAESECAEQKKENEKMKEENERLRVRLSENQSLLSGTRNELVGRLQHYEEMETKLQEELHDLNNQNELLRLDCHQLQKLVKQRDTDVSDLQEKVEKLQEANTKIRQQTKEEVKKILQKDLDEKVAIMKRKHESKVNKLRMEIKDLRSLSSTALRDQQLGLATQVLTTDDSQGNAAAQKPADTSSKYRSLGLGSRVHGKSSAQPATKISPNIPGSLPDLSAFSPISINSKLRTCMTDIQTTNGETRRTAARRSKSIDARARFPTTGDLRHVTSTGINSASELTALKEVLTDTLAAINSRMKTITEPPA